MFEDVAGRSYGKAFLNFPCSVCRNAPELNCSLTNLTQAIITKGYYRTGDDTAYLCTPATACLGNTDCSNGYTGYLCGGCVVSVAHAPPEPFCVLKASQSQSLF
eukprot:TRINITY_DN20903_c0_g1_i1.p1 TRINITY_DN20903_c0_g1~~TRINITY_DN20903_c0_g1_i1.p1  ORF type:complete len:104 (-),score=4.15 TRINITY_DN20903_c0_g1_i1:320-631(-)